MKKIFGGALIAGSLFLMAAFVSSCSDEMNTQEARNKCFEDLLPYIAGYYIPYPGDPAGSSSSSSNGNAVPSECATADDCPMAGEPRCADALCVAGKCGFLFKPVGKVESQIQGDCVSQYCDGQGKVIALPDVDPYNDGKQCTIDQCTNQGSINLPFPDGSPCPETGLGVCLDGECVMCIGSLTGSQLCEVGLDCVGTKCVPMHCSNSFKDVALGETAADCGGPCLPCATGYSCKVAADCIQGVCAGTCSVPTCLDGVKNDGETGIDCGGPQSCPRCPANQGCEWPSDCESGVCWAGFCQAPKCDDGIANGDEQSVDCGGSCAACGG